jgi:hypothetical protein
LGSGQRIKEKGERLSRLGSQEVKEPESFLWERAPAAMDRVEFWHLGIERDKFRDLGIKVLRN